MLYVPTSEFNVGANVIVELVPETAVVIFEYMVLLAQVFGAKLTYAKVD